MISFALFSILAVLRLFTTYATIYDIPCGDVVDLQAKLADAVPGDVLRLDACTYDTFASDPNFDLGKALPPPALDSPWNNDDDKEKGIIIVGATRFPQDTVLKAVMSFSFYKSVVFEDLTISAQGAETSLIYGGDSDQVLIYQNCILEASPPGSSYLSNVKGLFLLVMKTALIRTTVNLQSPNQNGKESIGVYAEGLVMLDSKVNGFDIGLEISPHDGSYFRIFNNDLTNNTEGISCGTRTPCPIDINNLVPNTPAGSKVNIGWNKVRNLFHEEYPNIPIKIKFPSVLVAGETIVYRKPAAYPPLDGPYSTGIGKPQYYQFESTAILEKIVGPAGKVKLFFSKSMIDVNFANPANVVALLVNSNGYFALKPLIMSAKTINGEDFYKVRFKKRSYLNCIIVFAERSSK